VTFPSAKGLKEGAVKHLRKAIGSSLGAIAGGDEYIRWNWMRNGLVASPPPGYLVTWLTSRALGPSGIVNG